MLSVKDASIILLSLFVYVAGRQFDPEICLQVWVYVTSVILEQGLRENEDQRKKNNKQKVSIFMPRCLL